MKVNILHLFLLVVVLGVLTWSGLSPKDYLTWFLEVSPVMVGLIVVLATYRRHPLTDLLYILIALHSVILCVGGKYTYAEVPAGFWVQEWAGFSRNHYDRLGHFFQGFMPAILAREILIRNQAVKPGTWRFLFVVSVCLAFSAFYEMIEWWVALATGEGAMAFLGTQGDVWDTQWDMFLALIGAISAQLLLSRVHDRQLLLFRKG